METIPWQLRACGKLTDECLTTELLAAAVREREDLVALLAHLAEFDRRRLDRKKGYPSLFEYCTRVLRYSGSAAARRIIAARAGRRFPSLLAMINRGDMHLSGAAMLAPRLTSQNHRQLLRQAMGKSQEEIARLLNRLTPRIFKRDSIRFVALSAVPAQGKTSVPIPSGRVMSDGSIGKSIEEAPLADKTGQPSAISASDGSLFSEPASQNLAIEARDHYRINFTATGETVRLLKRTQEVLRHRFPKGELDGIVRLALTKLLELEDRDKRRRTRRAARTSRRDKAKRSRRIPEGIKQQIWERDGGRCAYVGETGMRCGAKAWLEFDHIQPWALGGESDNIDNIRLLCREHNQLAAQRIFGDFYARNHNQIPQSKINNGQSNRET